MKKYTIVPDDVKVGDTVKLNPFADYTTELWNPNEENRLGVRSASPSYWAFDGESVVTGFTREVWIRVKAKGNASFPREFLLVKGVDYDE